MQAHISTSCFLPQVNFSHVCQSACSAPAKMFTFCDITLPDLELRYATSLPSPPLPTCIRVHSYIADGRGPMTHAAATDGGECECHHP